MFKHFSKIEYSFKDSNPLESTSCREYLKEGRRGAWLIPVSGDLPVARLSRVTWADTPEETEFPMIKWTDKRLTEFWKRTKFFCSIGLDIYVVAVFGSGMIPDHLKVSCKGEDALAVVKLIKEIRTEDKVPFLKRARLLWVDEPGEPILVAR